MELGMLIGLTEGLIKTRGSGLCGYPVVVLVGGGTLLSDRVLGSVLQESIPKQREDKYIAALADEFSGVVQGQQPSLTNLGLSEFIERVTVPALGGKWLCIQHIKHRGEQATPKKEQEVLYSYITKPSPNGRLIIQVEGYSQWLNDKVLQESKDVCMLQMSYPKQGVLRELIQSEVRERSVKEITDSACEVFIRRLGNKLDDYGWYIEQVIQSDYRLIDVPEIQKILHGVDNYEPLDFIKHLLKEDTPIRSKRAYKVLNSLQEDFGTGLLLHKLRDTIKNILEVRQAINQGQIPVGLSVDYRGVKQRLQKASLSISSLPAYKIREYTKIASELSLEDWLYMYQLIQSGIVRSEAGQCVSLYSLIPRRQLTHTQLLHLITPPQG